MLPAALATLAAGAIGVLGARDLSRLVAYGAIASMGTLLISVSLFTPQAAAAALYYTIHSTFAAALLFLNSNRFLLQPWWQRDGESPLPSGAHYTWAAEVVGRGAPWRSVARTKTTTRSGFARLVDSHSLIDLSPLATRPPLFIEALQVGISV